MWEVLDTYSQELADGYREEASAQALSPNSNAPPSSMHSSRGTLPPPTHGRQPSCYGCPRTGRSS
jgi:hypothetical protein